MDGEIFTMQMEEIVKATGRGERRRMEKGSMEETITHHMPLLERNADSIEEALARAFC